VGKKPCRAPRQKEGLDYRIPSHFIYMSLNKKATIVLYLVLQSTLTYVNEVARYSIIAPKEVTI